MQYANKKTTYLVSFLGSTICTFIGFFILMSGAFYRILFRTGGSLVYWIFSACFVTAGTFLSVEFSWVVAGMLLTVGIYSEFEKRGRGNYKTAIATVLFVSGFVSLILWQLLKLQNLTFTQGLDSLLNFLIVQQGQKLPPEFSTSKIGPLIPAIITIFNGLILGFGLILDRKIAKLFNLKFLNLAGQIKLFNLSAPEFLIWPLIIGFALSFAPVDPNVTVLGLNVFLICAFCFWFQGLAVIEFLMKSYSVGPFMKILFYILIVLQMPFILSGVGIIDFWLDVRTRLKRSKLKTTTQNEEKL